MKRVLLGLVAAVALTIIPAVAEAGNPYRYDRGRNSWNTGYRGDWDHRHHHDHYRRSPRVVYRPPVTVYRPVYPVYGINTYFYYIGPNASFGFGF